MAQIPAITDNTYMVNSFIKAVSGGARPYLFAVVPLSGFASELHAINFTML